MGHLVQKMQVKLWSKGFGPNTPLILHHSSSRVLIIALQAATLSKV